MLKLGGSIDPLSQPEVPGASLFTITADPFLPKSVRNRFALLTEHPSDVPGYAVQLVTGNDGKDGGVLTPNKTIYRLPAHFDYLKPGDIVFIDSGRHFLRTLFRKDSRHNSILLTEQCNHYCLMCSQPPKNNDDSYLLRRTFELIKMIPADTRSIGFTGGEPTLYGEALVELIKQVKLQLPNTSIGLLTNGRRFCDNAFTKRFAEIKHPDCMLGIPIYSDDPVRHDYVVQARGAFDETIRGILNLKRFGQKVEIRIVLHKQTIDRLVSTCEFICRNLVFADHVALMGLEITGFTRPNLDLLWIDPYDYKEILSEAVSILNSYGMNTSVYNHQLCVVNKDVDGNYCKSISDWKNEYLDACAPCTRKAECGGFFSSSKMYKHSAHIRPFA